MTNWLRPDTACTSDRKFCHVYIRNGQPNMVPDWPYSFLIVLQPGSDSWAMSADVCRLTPVVDTTEVSDTQIREVGDELVFAGQHRREDPEILIVMDAGYAAILEVLAAWPTPAALKHAGKARIDAKLKKHGVRRHTAWAAAALNALDAQTVTVVGTEAAGLVIPHLARQLIALHALRTDVASHHESMVEAHLLYPVLTPMPGIAVRTAVVFIAETSGKSFDSVAAMASYAGLAPTTRQSGTSIKSERVSHSGNKRLKRALFLSAFASIRNDLTSRDYYDRKRGLGKRHNQTLIALAHLRLTVLFATIRDGTLYDMRELKIA
ncbi:transposase [Glutamicibacter soli]